MKNVPFLSTLPIERSWKHTIKTTIQIFQICKSTFNSWIVKKKKTHIFMMNSNVHINFNFREHYVANESHIKILIVLKDWLSHNLR